MLENPIVIAVVTLLVAGWLFKPDLRRARQRRNDKP